MQNRISIEVHQYSPNCLEIRPYHEYGRYYYDRVKDLQILKDLLATYGLLENQDYVVDNGQYPKTSPDCAVVFSGEFRVLNALFSFPKEGAPIGEVNKKYSYAMQLTKYNCNKFSVPFVLEAQEKYFNDLKNEICNLNKTFNNNNPALIQLKNDMDILSERKDVLFEFNNFNLLLSALHKAIECEKSNLKGQKSGNVFTPTSDLLNKYDDLIQKYAAHTPLLFTWSNHKYLPIYCILNTCYNQIGSSTRSNSIDNQMKSRECNVMK